MKLIIDIPEEVYKSIQDNDYCGILNSDMYNAVKNGTPLPKGHGNLIQREDAEALFRNARKALYELSRKEPIKDFQTRELMLLNAEQIVHLIEPIIEAEIEE